MCRYYCIVSIWVLCQKIDRETKHKKMSNTKANITSVCPVNTTRAKLFTSLQVKGRRKIPMIDFFDPGVTSRPCLTIWLVPWIGLDGTGPFLRHPVSALSIWETHLIIDFGYALFLFIFNKYNIKEANQCI